MAITYFKKASKTAATDESNIRARVEELLSDIEQGGEARVRALAQELDKWTGDIVVSAEAFAAAEKLVPDKIKQDIQFAHANVKRFAEAQRASIHDMQIEVSPGVIAGHRNIPLETAGCYAPGGRYATAGAIAGPDVALDLRTLYLHDITMFGCTVLGEGVFDGLVRLIELGEVMPLVAAVFALDQIVEAQQLFLTKQHIGKIVLRVD